MTDECFADDLDVYVSDYTPEERFELAAAELAIEIATVLYHSGSSPKSVLLNEVNTERMDGTERFDGRSPD